METARKIKQAGSSALTQGKSAIYRTDEFARDLPPWAKGVIVVGVLFIGYKIYQGFTTAVEQSKLNQQSRDSKQEEEGWFKEAEKENSKGGAAKATLTKTQMKSVANKLFNQLDGYGTRDTGIVATFKSNVKNNADFAGVNAAYGIRTLQPGHGVGWLVADFRGTLIESINNEAADATITDTNKYLSDKGIKYRI